VLCYLLTRCIYNNLQHLTWSHAYEGISTHRQKVYKYRLATYGYPSVVRAGQRTSRPPVVGVSEPCIHVSELFGEGWTSRMASTYTE